MPLYAYRCPSCDHREEHLQRLADAPIERCARCGEATRRVVTAAAFHLKGGGWYADGYASAKGDTARDGGGVSGSGGSGSGGSGSGAGSSSGDGGAGSKTDAAKPASTSSGGGGTCAGGGTSP